MTERFLDTPSPWCDFSETHSGVVLFLGDLAYKFKKPVDLGFLDFRDRDQRRRVCEREVELNSRLSPDVYLGVGGLVDPSGVAEPAVVMRRLPDEYRLSSLIQSGEDITGEVGRIARVIASFHAGATTGPDIESSGTRAALRGRWDANLAESEQFAGRFVDASVLAELTSLVRRYLDGREDLFTDRIARGAIVDGHGDLTPQDVFCLPDGPRLLDCLEFDERLRHVDRLDDIAFLAMGLEVLGAPWQASRLISKWAEYLDDPAPPSLIHHFVAYRAFVRAKVGWLRAAQAGAEQTPEVDQFVDLALAHLRSGAVKLVLVGGAPGCGKSTLAGAIADRLGMVVISSDRVRKERAGIDPSASAAAPISHGIYDDEHTAATYRELLHRAEMLLRRGESVVLDASWTRADDRQRAESMATDMSVDLVEIRCDVDPATAVERIKNRSDISDADHRVAEELRRQAERWPSSYVIDTGRPVDECRDLACAQIRTAETGHNSTMLVAADSMERN